MKRKGWIGDNLEKKKGGGRVGQRETGNSM